MLSKQIFDVFIKHDTLLHPDAVEHIQDQDDPLAYVNELVGSIENFPLVLTMNDLKNIEAKSLRSTRTDVADKTISEPDVQQSDLENLKTTMTRKSQVEPELAYFGDGRNAEDSTTSRNLAELPGPSMVAGAVMKVNAVKEDMAHSHPGELIHEMTTDDEKSPVDISDQLRDGFEHRFKILSDITGKSTCEGKLADFTQNINHRFRTLRGIISSSHPHFRRTVPLNRVNLNLTYEVYIIGMISEINRTKKDNLILSLEDEMGEVKVFINKDKSELDMRLLVDEVIGVAGDVNTNLGMVMANKIVRPQPPRNRMINHSERDVDAVFISDIHVGSIQFMENEWHNFIRWLNGDYKLTRHYAPDKVRYLVVAGDLVDGIGIYPDQEDELDIKDIYKQYKVLAEHLSGVPDHIKIILAPGNHDAVRQAEPQPALRQEFQKYFDADQTVFVGNPCYLSLEGVEVLLYHGRSFDDIVKFIPEATYTNPILPMKEILYRRHLVPIYGERTPIAPEHSDLLLLNNLPDIFVTGHVHTTGCERYNNIMMINASAWQAQTSYQKTLNFNPDPCKAFLVNLATVRAAEMDFSNPNH